MVGRGERVFKVGQRSRGGESGDAFFKDGFPFTDALRANQVALTDANTIRNFIAHESVAARAKFEKIVRRELAALPANTTAGGFLGMTAPHSAPPISFLETYFTKLEACARRIIP